jgi:hypothetical protein
VRSELKARAETYPEHSPARAGVHTDAERILRWLENEARPRADGIAIFACSAMDFFEAAQLEVPIEESEVFIGPAPHLYPLAAVADRYRRHVAVVLDTHLARVYVFALGEVTAERSALDATLRALANGQVHELVLTADPAALKARDGRHGAEVADELVARARQTDARVTFIEDASLLASAGGVAGLLRFRVRRAA